MSYCVRDVGSTTGTFLKIPERHEFALFPGLMLKLGSECEFVVGTLSGSACELIFFEGVLAGSTVSVTNASGYPYVLGQRLYRDQNLEVQDADV